MTLTEPTRVSGDAGDITRIVWDDLNRPDHPGEYQLRGLLVVVTLTEVEIWEDHPDASFALIQVENGGQKRYSLGMPDWGKESTILPVLPP